MPLTNQEYLQLNPEEFFKTVQQQFTKNNKGQRLGQFFMNSLPEALYNKISNTEADCFYNNDRIPAFKREVTRHWDTFKPRTHTTATEANFITPFWPIDDPKQLKDNHIAKIEDSLLKARISAEENGLNEILQHIEQAQFDLDQLKKVVHIGSSAPQA